MVEPLERERLQRLRAILDGLAGAGFTLAIFDTAGADGPAVRLVTEAADLCLLPARPTRLDVEATAATFRARFPRQAQSRLRAQPVPADLPQRARRARRPKASPSSACSPSRCCRRAWIIRTRSPRVSASPNTLRGGRAAQEIKALWNWSRAQFDGAKNEAKIEAKIEAKSERPAEQRANRQAAA